MARTAVLAFALLACLALAQASRSSRELIQTHSSTQKDGSEVDRNYNPKNGPPQTLDLDDILYKKALGLTPEQLSITYWAPGTYLFSWVTGDAQVGVGLTAPDPTLVASTVQIGESSDLSKYDEFTGSAVTYTMDYSGYPGYNVLDYASGVIHHTLVTGLKAGTTYYYRVGDARYAFSQIISFKTVPTTFPVKIAVTADTGQTQNTSTTIQHMKDNEPDLVLNVGDLAYVDTYDSKGTLACGVASDFAARAGAPFYEKAPKNLVQICDKIRPPGIVEQPETYQPRYDSWARLWEQIFAYIPAIQVSGNHETDLQADGTMYAGYNARYPQAQDPSVINTNAVSYFSDQSDDNLYSYSEIPGVGVVIMLSSMVPQARFGTPYDKQYAWLEAKLKSIDRKSLPWLMVGFHYPVYTSDTYSFKGNECFRQAYEPLWYKYGVDVVFNGHVHAYERSYPVYDFKLDDCGPVHIVVGSGGNDEGLSNVADDATTKWVESTAPTVPFCSDPESRQFPNYQPQRCFSYQDEYPAKYKNYCPDKVSSWVAYRETNFGSGIFTILSHDRAKWEWHQNLNGAHKVTDEVTITRGRDKCAAQRKL